MPRIRGSSESLLLETATDKRTPPRCCFTAPVVGERRYCLTAPIFFSNAEITNPSSKARCSRSHPTSLTVKQT